MASSSIPVSGNGKPIVFLHGFPFNHHIWKDFIAPLAASFRIYTPDLPGFGDATPLAQPFTIEQVALALLQEMEENDIVDPIVIGHSLGGYVALAMAGAAPGRLSGIGLFHSTALPDSDEKKENRNKVIAFVEKNGAPAFTENFIPPLFANQTHPAIAMVRQIASLSPAETVIGYVRAMRDRPDTTSVLKTFSKPVLFIAGEKDGGIPADSVRKQSTLCKHPDVHIIPDVAHMGMLEMPLLTAGFIEVFAKRVR